MSETTTEPQVPQTDTEAMVKALPEPLQDSVRDFQAELVRDIIAQHTTFEGEEVVVKVTPDRVEWYKKRLDQVLESGVFNPHIHPEIIIGNK